MATTDVENRDSQNNQVTCRNLVLYVCLLTIILSSLLIFSLTSYYNIALGIPNLFNRSSNLTNTPASSHPNSVIPNEYVFVREWGSAGHGYGQLNSPSGIAVDPTGKVYVADTGKNTIDKFYSNGTFITKWGNSSQPSGIAIDPLDNVYVADTGNNIIEKFTSDGKFAMHWPLHVFRASGMFDDPIGITTDLGSNVYVADTGHDQTIRFHFSNSCHIPSDTLIIAAGICAYRWGYSGNGNGNFSSPSGIATAPSGNVYVSDSGNNRIQKFTKAGNFVTKWGSLGSADGQFSVPSAIAIDSSSGNVYVADKGNSRIQVFVSR